MHQACLYDPIQRQEDKQRAREADDRALRSGSASQQDLRARNGLFSSVVIVGSSLRRRGIAA